jgi:hypothetical protein
MEVAIDVKHPSLAKFLQVGATYGVMIRQAQTAITAGMADAVLHTGPGAPARRLQFELDDLDN